MQNNTGIVNSQLPKPIKQPADEFKAPEVKPLTTQVDAKTETVESRLNDLTAKGSRYTNLAAADTRRNANSRGLVNSVMASAAGTEAAIRSALPIAQQDSKTYTDTRLNNQNVENKFLENRQGANLTQEVNAQGSQLRKGENAQNADLNIKVATAQSGLNQTENDQLNSLQMKRDQGLSTLTQAENEQLSQLTAKRDASLADITANQSQLDNQLAINRDNNSSALNENLATLESSLKQNEMKLDAGLKMTVEEAIQSQIMSDNAKMNILTSINQIISDSQAQIVQVGISDRTGAQQTAAIIDIKTNRDAALQVYQTMLKSFPSWKWGTDLTPKDNAGVPAGGNTGQGGTDAGGRPTAAPGTNYPTYPTDPAQAQQIESSVARQEYKDQNVAPSGTVQYSGNPAPAWQSSDGRWKWTWQQSDNTYSWQAGTWGF